MRFAHYLGQATATLWLSYFMLVVGLGATLIFQKGLTALPALSLGFTKGRGVRLARFIGTLYN